MQNTVRWRSDRLDGAVVGSLWGTPSQTKVMHSTNVVMYSPMRDHFASKRIDFYYFTTRSASGQLCSAVCFCAVQWCNCTAA